MVTDHEPVGSVLNRLLEFDGQETSDYFIRPILPESANVSLLVSIIDTKVTLLELF
jgi:sorbitol-specific phosphotransferase system component IIBC